MQLPQVNVIYQGICQEVPNQPSCFVSTFVVPESTHKLPAVRSLPTRASSSAERFQEAQLSNSNKAVYLNYNYSTVVFNCKRISTSVSSVRPKRLFSDYVDEGLVHAEENYKQVKRVDASYRSTSTFPSEE